MDKICQKWKASHRLMDRFQGCPKSNTTVLLCELNVNHRIQKIRYSERMVGQIGSAKSFDSCFNVSHDLLFKTIH